MKRTLVLAERGFDGGTTNQTSDEIRRDRTERSADPNEQSSPPDAEQDGANETKQAPRQDQCAYGIDGDVTESVIRPKRFHETPSRFDRAKLLRDFAVAQPNDDGD